MMIALNQLDRYVTVVTNFQENQLGWVTGAKKIRRERNVHPGILNV